LAIERTVDKFTNAGDEVDEAIEEAGLGHALATRTPGPNTRRGDFDPLYFGMGAGTKETEPGVGLRNVKEDLLGFADWSGSN